VNDTSLYEEVIRASGLSPIFAKNTISRALTRANVAPTTMSREDLSRALPEIKKSLALFLESDLEPAMRRIQALTKS